MSPIQGTAPQAPPPPPPKVSNVPAGAQGVPGGADADGDNDGGAAAAAVASKSVSTQTGGNIDLVA